MGGSLGADAAAPRHDPGRGVVARSGMVSRVDRREWTTQLRGAVYRRDGPAVLAVALDPARPAGLLQLLGDGLAVALGQRVDHAR